MVHLSVRVPAAVAARLDEYAASLSRPGLDINRSQALRALMQATFDRLDSERQGG